MRDFDQFAAKNYPVFLGSEFEHPAAEDAFFHVIPIPFLSTASVGHYGEKPSGFADGPRSILEASWSLEPWDGQSTPGLLGIYTHPPVEVYTNAVDVINSVSKVTQQVLNMGKFPLSLCSSQSLSYGAVRGFLEAGMKDFGVVHIGAHANLKELGGNDCHNRASVMKRVLDHHLPLIQIGVRVYSEEEMRNRKLYGVCAYDAEELVANNVQHIELPMEFPERVFFSINVDGLDPSVFPAGGSPVPGGLGWYQMLSLFESVSRQREIVGFDLCEFAPINDIPAYQRSAALLAYKLMGIVERSKL